MNKYFIVILCFLLGFFISLNINLLFKETICKYNINSDFYYEDITVFIKRFDKVKVEKKYEFNDEEVMKIEIEDLKEQDYKLSINNNDVIAYKFENKSSYFKDKKKYSKLGFIQDKDMKFIIKVL